MVAIGLGRGEGDDFGLLIDGQARIEKELERLASVQSSASSTLKLVRQDMAKLNRFLEGDGDGGDDVGKMGSGMDFNGEADYAQPFGSEYSNPRMSVVDFRARAPARTSVVITGHGREDDGVEMKARRRRFSMQAAVPIVENQASTWRRSVNAGEGSINSGSTGGPGRQSVHPINNASEEPPQTNVKASMSSRLSQESYITDDNHMHAEVTPDSLSLLPLTWPSSIKVREEVEQAIAQPTANEAMMRTYTVMLKKDAKLSFAKMTRMDSSLSLSEDAHLHEPGWFLNRISRYKLEPTAPPRIVLDVACLIALSFDMVMTPFTLAWTVPFNGFIMWVSISTCAIWTLDIVLTFRTGFYRDGVVVMSSREIVRQYVRTFFFPDLIVSICDWASVVAQADHAFSNAQTSSGLVALTRISKIGRLLRFMQMLRVLRITERFERIMDRADWSDTTWIVIDVLRLIVVIVWFMHIMACGWYALGLLVDQDTGTGWLLMPMDIFNGAAFYEATIPYQYLTSLHWAMTQVTPGSMEVFPRNSAERVYNILSLFTGFLVFTSLVSSLSAKLTQFALMAQGPASKMQLLRRFLREANVKHSLAVRIQKQVKQRMSSKMPLTVKDVTALDHLSSSMRLALQYDMCKQHLQVHPLLRLWEEVDAHAVQQVCNEAVSQMVVLPGGAVFNPRSFAVGAYYCITGELIYTQIPMYARVMAPEETEVPMKTWFCEAALWTDWVHVGKLEATRISELLMLEATPFILAMTTHEVLKDISIAYCKEFHKRLAAAAPPQAAWPTDISAQFTKSEEIFVAFPYELRRFIGMVAIDVLARTSRRPEHLRELKREIHSGACTVLLTSTGVTRAVTVSTLWISREDGDMLVQLGEWQEQNCRIRPNCQLPGTKQKEGELPDQAAKRVLKKQIRPFAEHVQFQGNGGSHIEVGHSHSFAVQTKYLRTVHYGVVENTLRIPRHNILKRAVDANALMPTLSQTLQAQGGFAKSLSTLSEKAGDEGSDSGMEMARMRSMQVISSSDVYIFANGNKVKFFAWLTEEAYQRFSESKETPQLQAWLDDLQITQSDVEACLEAEQNRGEDGDEVDGAPMGQASSMTAWISQSQCSGAGSAHEDQIDLSLDMDNGVGVANERSSEGDGRSVPDSLRAQGGFGS